MNKLSRQLRCQLLQALVEGMSQRSCERLFGVSNKTIAKLLHDAGNMAISFVANMRDLQIKHIQADELWAFVSAKQKNVNDMKVPVVGAGTVWTYLAICADTKFIIAYKLGDRKLYDCTAFMRSVESKLRRRADGALAVRPKIVTDGLKSYVEAGDLAFGDEADRGMLIKKYTSTDANGDPLPGSRYDGADPKTLIGRFKKGEIHTSYIERQNLNLRMGNRRYTRKSNAFSKRLACHERHLALSIMYHNFCKTPRPIRPRRDSLLRSWQKRLPPAMAVGLTDRPWDIEDLLDLTDQFTSKAGMQVSSSSVSPPSGGPQLAAANEADLPPYWVYRSEGTRTARVHLATCSCCRNGHGRGGEGRENANWLPCNSLEDAVHTAVHLEPDRHDICSICLGTYQTLRRRAAKGVRSRYEYEMRRVGRA